MINFIKGFIIGIGKIIPGVSGAMLATIMGVYDKYIFYICNFKNNIKAAIKYLFPIGIGVIVSIILFSKIISLCLDKYYVITMLFFIGLIIGGFSFIVNKVNKSDYYISIISFVIFFLIVILNINNSYVIKNNFFDFIMFFVSGIFEAIGSIIPGISGTALLMLFGTYDIIVYSIGNITNIRIIIPFVIGVIVTVILLVKVVDYLFRKHNNKMYAFILGMFISSVVLLIIQIFKTKVYISDLIIGIIFMICGIVISNVFDEK